VLAKRIQSKVESLLGVSDFRWKHLPNGVYVLNLHRIGDVASSKLDPNVYSCSAEKLQQHLTYLKQYFDIISLSELIESTEPYVPVTTQINIVSDLGSNKYELFFDAINYDLNLFKVGETVKSLKGKTATIDSIDPAINSCVITSSVDWRDEVDGRFLSSNEYTASGTLTRYYKNGNKFMADITGSTGYWIDSYNNRRQKMTFDTRFPKGGSHVDLNASTFVASPLVVDNSVLYLTKVLWRVNGVEFDVPVTDPYGKQEWYVPADAMIEDAVNIVTVTYYAGQNKSKRWDPNDGPDPSRVEFIPKSTPFRVKNTVDLLNRIETYTTEVTTLGL